MRKKSTSFGNKRKQVNQTRQSRNPTFSMGKNKEKHFTLASELEEYAEICHINKAFLYKLDI
ncbi:hypothetical protein TTHERM_00732800 (macronuclear) [Tetrahymena thermophila SB210]|uniref:Uncharacterized protein n=1 Tax=Tetrahymena thermophila (strain SB210) TaxID=312017 RepID=Q245D1_TETTS|nr:hypothetical protein TTHERM_00732800 [Tetrahymena thermophila SB210]EAS03433.1 hypothetical protein TTHERM_00732800 [Tetrahymena thermophila SB210]|eukprot:XP_001023678.1 hypothetical protein TTHERM_00732800 [Tetrahymena thermophila SB210]